MRVLVVSHSCTVGVNQQVFAELEQEGQNHVALLVPQQWPSEYSEEFITAKKLEGSAFEFWPMPVTKAGSIPLHFYPRLPWGKIRAFKPDVVLSQQEPYSLSGAQALNIAARLHIPFFFQTNQNILKRYPLPFSWIEQKHLKKAACVLAYSDEAGSVMRSKGRGGCVEVVPYATDISHFYPRDNDDLRETLGIGDAVCIGYIGRIIPEKGLDTLLHAAALLSGKTKANFKLLFVGSGVQKSALQARAAELTIADNVIFVDAVPHAEVGQYMSCLDIFVLPSRTTPSWKEQFGRVIIEALACAVPVVGSDSGAIPHLIKATGGGLVFAEGNAEALAGCLEELVSNARTHEKLGAAGRKAVQDRFSCQAVAKQMTALLSKAVESNGKRGHARYEPG